MVFKGGNHRYCDNCSLKVEKEKSRLRIVHYHEKNTYFCLNCGKVIYNYKFGNHRYCKDCSLNIRAENIRFLMISYRKRWKDVLPVDLGTGWLSHHPKADFDSEYSSVRNEYRRLGLKYHCK